MHILRRSGLQHGSLIVTNDEVAGFRSWRRTDYVGVLHHKSGVEARRVKTIRSASQCYISLRVAMWQIAAEEDPHATLNDRQNPQILLVALVSRRATQFPTCLDRAWCSGVSTSHTGHPSPPPHPLFEHSPPSILTRWSDYHEPTHVAAAVLFSLVLKSRTEYVTNTKTGT